MPHKFITETKKKIKTVISSKAISYLRGAAMVNPDSAMSQELLTLRKKLMDSDATYREEKD